MACLTVPKPEALRPPPSVVTEPEAHVSELKAFSTNYEVKSILAAVAGAGRILLYPNTVVV